MLEKVKRGGYLLLYYYIAKQLPPTNKNFIGKFGGILRNFCAKHLFKSCGTSINIEHGATFGSGAGIELGSHSNIGINCHVPNNIKIGDYVMFGPECFVTDNITHNYDRTDIPISTQGSHFIDRRTEIGDDVWIGRQSLILCGKHIGSHTIIGAGSVVSKDVPDNVMAAGNPIRVIKNR